MNSPMIIKGCDFLDVAGIGYQAVGSMLSSLDPYTEFEDKQLAQDMREQVSGRYGGVGLVIAGSKTKAKDPPLADTIKSPSTTPDAMEVRKGHTFMTTTEVFYRLLWAMF